MKKGVLDRVTLEYDVAGNGEAIVFIHGALIADSFAPMLLHSSLPTRYRCVTYHRRGYEGSTRVIAPIRVEDHASDCASLLRQLNVSKAHVVGHSFGGAIALSLAMDAPQLVHTITLMEPALVLGASGPGYRKAIARDLARYRAGDADGTVDEFLSARFGTTYREPLERVLPGSFSQAVANARTSFESDMPAAADFQFGEEQARTITHPALIVLGADSDALWSRFGETHRLLCAWLRDVESFVLPAAAHGMQMQNPGHMGERLHAFLRKHPIEG